MNKRTEYPASEAYFRAKAEECPDHVLYDLAVQADADENLKREAEHMLFTLPYGLDDFSMLVMKAGGGDLDVILVNEDGLLAGMRQSVPTSELEEAVQTLAIRHAMFFLRYEKDALVPYGSEHHSTRRSHVVLGEPASAFSWDDYKTLHAFIMTHRDVEAAHGIAWVVGSNLMGVSNLRLSPVERELEELARWLLLAHDLE